MEPVGFVGIMKLTWQIIFKDCKHFLCIALVLALPYALNWIVLDPSSNINAIQSIIASVSMLYRLLASKGPLPSPADLPPSTKLPLSLLIALFIFSLLIILVCTPLLTLSVCRSCLNKSFDLEGSLRRIPRSVINLLLTALCEFAVLFVVFAAAMVVMVIIAAVVSAMNANPAIPMSIWALGTVILGVYLAVSFSLADAVAILEEKKGWEAMRRSMYVLGGRKWLAFGLSCVFSVCFMLLPIPVSKEASLLAWWSAAAVSLSLQAFIALFSMCAHVVLYMSCKSLREEPLDTLIAASSHFGPQGLSTPKYLDLETAALHSTAL